MARRDVAAGGQQTGALPPGWLWTARLAPVMMVIFGFCGGVVSSLRRSGAVDQLDFAALPCPPLDSGMCAAGLQWVWTVCSMGADDEEEEGNGLS